MTIVYPLQIIYLCCLNVHHRLEKGRNSGTAFEGDGCLISVLVLLCDTGLGQG